MHFNNYLKSIDKEYSFIKKFAKPRNKICGVTIDDLAFLPYKILKKKVPELFEEQKFDEAIHLILKHYKKNITFIRVKFFVRSNVKLLFIFWVKQQYKLIEETEKRYLYNPPDQKLLQAGIKELDILGDKPMINNMVKDFNGAYTHKQLKNKSYSFIFNIQLENAIMARVNKRLVEINKIK